MNTTSPIKNRLTITSKEISTLTEMDLLFEDYCRDSAINLDFTKSACLNAYSNEYTSDAYCWFIHGVFRAIGNEHLEDLINN